ncbi:hypothetical protein GCM10010921_28700 [Microbacterium album]|uniref:HTH lacI-type domain-containing protein n=1 Tax=Microbacterium album TaxID=2053191 RepID=A0A917MNN6_9MICO|nr:hypothetical protein GCM10010921_28700 [Microbacterium album]
MRPELQQRVLDAVARLGYRRNENARSIRPGQHSGLIGVAITNIGNPYYGNFALGVEEVAAERGRRVLLGNTGEDLDRERQLVSDFVGRQVEGLIVVPSGPSGEHLRAEALGGLPVVLASRQVGGIDADAVLLDDVEGARQATERLVALGHERIAFLGNNVSMFTAGRRYEGFRRALEAAGIAEDPALASAGQQDLEAARAAMTRLLDLAEPPTAVFAANNRNTIGALQVIARRLADGRLAEAPALASFDDVELIEFVPAPTVVVSHDARELGGIAARMLFERLDGFDGPPRFVELPVSVQA